MAIVGYERSYVTGRRIASVLEVIGWIAVALGVLLAVIAFVTAGINSVLRGETPFLVLILALLPGVAFAVVGLFFIAFIQALRSTIDTAEMTRELLSIARRIGGDVASRTNAGRLKTEVLAPSVPSNKPVRSSTSYPSSFEHRGKTIRHNNKSARVGSKVFDTIEEARQFIDNN